LLFGIYYLEFININIININYGVYMNIKIKYKVIILFFIFFVFITPYLSIAGMQVIEEKELADISGKSGMDIVIDLGASVNNFRYSNIVNSTYIEFGGITIDDGAGGSTSLGTFADPFLFDIIGNDPASGLTVNYGYWRWNDTWFDDDWFWSPGSVSGTGGMGSYLALEFPDNPTNIDLIRIKVDTLNFNGRYIGTQVDTSATSADALTDLEISGVQLNYLNDSTSSHLYIASANYTNPKLTYTSNTSDYTDAAYDSAIDIDDGAANYPGDGAFDEDHDIAATGPYGASLIPDQNIGFGSVGGGIFIDLALQAKISELMYVYNPYSGTPDSYLTLSNVHLFNNFATAPNYSSNNAAAWPTMQGALNLGLFSSNNPVAIDVSGGATPHITIILPIKGSIRVENVSFTHEGVSNDGAAANHPNVNVLGPIMADLLDATGPARYIKIELPVSPAGGWLTHANTTIY